MNRNTPSRTTFLVLLLAALTVILLSPVSANEYRAWWVDGWGSPGFMSQSEVDQLLGVPGNASKLGDIRNANCNAVFVEVRRSSDVAYNSNMGEPFFSGLSPSNFDALQAIINAAHDTTGGKKRIEVHCWMVVFRTSGGTVYGAHHDTPTGSLTTLDNYWPTRDNSGAEESNKAFDPGHPLCEDYITKVYMDIANNYDIDGIHYDYVRFTANNLGYNPTSLARYHAAHPTYTYPPTASDANWQQWRRDQVTDLLRRIYHKMQVVKPNVKVSGAFIGGAPGPSSSTRAGFTAGTQAYTQYYQDWDSWLQEGIVDMAVPMTYFDLSGSYSADWTKWINFEKDRHGNRQMIIGPGLYLNSLSNAITELQQIRTASPAGNYADGFSGYEYQEPFASGTWSGWSSTFTSQITPTWDDVPVMTWKTAPTKGHLHGTVFNGSAWVDGAHITTTAGGDQMTDGDGFYGFVDMAPGTYTITCDATAQGLGTQTKTFTIAAGQATVVNFTWGTTTGMSGYVRTTGGAAVVGARIVGSNGAWVSTSGSDGSYTLPGMTAGTYAFKAAKTNYTTNTKSVTVTAGATANVNFTIDPTGGAISGYVRDSQGDAVAGATVATGTGGYSATSASDGSYTISSMVSGTYSVTASFPYYASQTVNSISVTSGYTTNQDFVIDPYPPVITSVSASGMTTTSATITWTTNVPCTSQVEYGKTKSMGTLTTTDPTLVTSHSVSLTGLTQNHIYNYRVTSVNAIGQSATSDRSMFFTLAPAAPAGTPIVVDNSDPGFSILTGSWSTGTSSSDKYGADYRFASTVTGSATATCSWTPTLPTTGSYDVKVWYPQGGNRATNSPFTITYNGGSTTVTVNQQTGGGAWNTLATGLSFVAGTSGKVTLGNNALASKVVVADAVEFVPPSDATPPTVPTGLTPTAASTSQIDLTWSASTDASGVAGYKIYRGAVLLDAVDSGTSYSDAGLTTNTSYAYSVAAYDIYGNTSAPCSAVTRATYCEQLTPGDITCDKPTAVWQSASNVFTFTNTDGFGGQNIDHLRYAWDCVSNHTWTDSEAVWPSGTQACQANPGGNNWFIHARAYNADNIPNGQIDLGPFKCDITPPTTPAPTAAKYITVTNQLACSWTASADVESGVPEYQYAIGTAPGDTSIVPWTTNGANTSVTAAGLSLALDQPYYFSVKARNGSGLFSAVANSGGTTPARACTSIAQAKGYANNMAVVLTGRYVGYGAGDGAFIQDPNRVAALWLPDVTTFAPGNIVNVGGILGTNGILRVLTSPEPAVTGGPATIAPLGMICASLGGAQLNTWTPGMPGSSGANNLGLLVKVTGQITSSAATYFMISDGSREIQVQSTLNPGSGYAVVTGISSWTTYSGQTIPLVITRSASDVQTF